MAPRKSTPKGIDPAWPNRNFVNMSFENKNDMDGFYRYMYDDTRGFGTGLGGEKPKEGPSKSNVHGHGIGQRAGKLRLSGNKNAHRIGKR